MFANIKTYCIYIGFRFCCFLCIGGNLKFCTLGCSEFWIWVNRTLEAFGRGTLGNEIGFEASARKSKNWILLVAIHQQPPWNVQYTHLLPWWGHKEFAVCSTSLPGTLSQIPIFTTELVLHMRPYKSWESAKRAAPSLHPSLVRVVFKI